MAIHADPKKILARPDYYCAVITWCTNRFGRRHSNGAVCLHFVLVDDFLRLLICRYVTSGDGRFLMNTKIFVGRLLVVVCLLTLAGFYFIGMYDLRILKVTGSCSSCNLSDANLYEHDLNGANLEKTILTRTDLRMADLRSANLRSANLVEADLSGADLENADLFGADLRGAKLAGDDVDGLTILDADIDKAIFCRTIMPDGKENNSKCK